jgi:glycosyltransferase involved in cell wall biosynthesis
MGKSILALAESADHVCCRYRIEAFRPHWEAAGHSLTVRPLGRGLRERWKAIQQADDFDAVILQRKLLSRWEVQRLRKRSRKLVFDFDDAVWLRDSYSPKGFGSAKRQRRFRRIVGCADAVVPGNRFLAEHAVKSCGAARVAVVPTCVEPAKYPPAEHSRPPGEVKLAWLGSSSTLQGIERQRAMIDAIADAVPGATFKVVCDRFPTFDRMTVEPVAWSEATEAAELADADIGIGWVPDDPWSRGKCGLKILQYQAAGLAVVANPVGVQEDMVRPGETGVPARTTEEWVKAVAALAADPELRKRLGRGGRANVEAHYSVAVGAHVWLDLFERL